MTIATLVASGLISKVVHGVKLLGGGAGTFSAKLDLTVTQASGSAIAAVEAAGGSIITVYMTDLALRSQLKPRRFSIPIRSPAPSPKDMKYYLAYANRGYLSSEVQLAELKRRLAAGVPAPLAAALLPVFVGGAPLVEGVHLIDIQVDAAAIVATQAGAAAAGSGKATAAV